MRLLITILALVCLTAAYKPRNPLKTKKYKCVELAEDEEIRIVSKSKGVRTYSREEEKPVASISKISSGETIEMPQAHRFEAAERIMPARMRPTTTPEPATTMAPPPPDYPSEVQYDSKGHPLVLSPEHCQMVKRYSKMYGVTDVMHWVKGNCRMAQMFVPGATCEDINTLVGSCYRNKFL